MELNIKDILKKIEQSREQARIYYEETRLALEVQDFEKAKKFSKKTSHYAYRALQYCKSKEVKINVDAEDAKKCKKLAKEAQQDAISAHIAISGWEPYKLNIERILGFLNVLFKLTLAFGFVLMFVYLLFKIKYFPSGLSLADGVGFIFLALGYVVFYLTFQGVFLFPFLGVVHFCKKIWDCCKGKKEAKNIVADIVFFMGSLLISSIICYFFIEFSDGFGWIPFFFFTFIGSYLMNVIYENEFGGQPKNQVIIYMLIGMLMVVNIPIVESTGVPILNNILINLKFSEKSTTLLLSNSDYKTIQKIATQEGLPVLYSCEQDNDTEVRNIDILWNNLGESIYIELPKNAKGETVRTELKRAETKVVSKISKKNNIKGCVFVHIPNLFSSGSDELSVQVKSDIKEKNLNWLETLPVKYVIKEVVIKGYADYTPYKKQGGNEVLSQNRAQAVSNYLSTIYQREIIESKGEGNKNANDECKKKFTSQADIDFCQGMNRGVTLQFHIEYQPK